MTLQETPKKTPMNSRIYQNIDAKNGLKNEEEKKPISSKTIQNQ